MIEEGPTELTIARWRDRFLAWLIDFTIVSVGIGIVYFIYESTLSTVHPSFHALNSIIFFSYWIILESRTGQSIGKRVLNIKVTKLDGKPVDIKDTIISSFGKAFLLPIDLILGWLLTNKKRQRIFNRLSDTIVIKVDSQKEEANVSYKLD